MISAKGQTYRSKELRILTKAIHWRKKLSSQQMVPRSTGYPHAKRWSSIHTLHHTWKLTQDGSQTEWEKIANHLPNKGLVTKKDKEFSKMSNKKTNHSIFLNGQKIWTLHQGRHTGGISTSKDA